MAARAAAVVAADWRPRRTREGEDVEEEAAARGAGEGERTDAPAAVAAPAFFFLDPAGDAADLRVGLEGAAVCSMASDWRRVRRVLMAAGGGSREARPRRVQTVRAVECGGWVGWTGGRVSGTCACMYVRVALLSVC